MFAEHLVLHSLGLCVAFVLALAVLKLARRDPVVGYRLLLILLGAGLVLPALTLPIAGRATTAGDRVLARFAVEPAPAAPPAIDAPARRDAVPATSAPARESSVAPGPGATVTLAAKHEALRVATTKKVTPRAPSLRTRVRDAAVASSAWLRRATPYVILGWILGAVLVGRRLLLRILGTARIVRDATPVVDDRTLSCWRIASAGHAIAQDVELRRSEAVDAPACWGVLRPVILLPAVGGAPHDALTFALRHELVHLERRDPLAAIAQAVLKTVYWFHPVAWWLSARIDRIRELACDELVVSNETQRKRYALALIDHAQAALAVPAFASPAHSPTLLHRAPTLPQLRRRIDMLLTKSTPLPLRRRLFVLGGAACAVLLLLAAQGTVAATLLSDEPLSERLVAFCPPKTTKPTAPPLILNPSDPKQKPANANKAKKAKKAKDSGITQAPIDPFAPYIPPSLSSSFVLPGNELAAARMLTFNTSDDGTMRDALIHVLTSSNDASARSTAAKALGTRLSDPEVRRAFAKVLRDEWEGSEVREAVGDALLNSEQFTPEAHEIIAALLKREVDDGSKHDFTAEAGDHDDGDADDEDSEDLDAELLDLGKLHATLGSDLEGLDAELKALDFESLEQLSNLHAELGTLEGLSIDLGDAIKSLECDVDCEESCEEEDGDDESDDADDRKGSIVNLLNSVRENGSAENSKHLLNTLQQKKSEGVQAIELRDLLRVMFKAQTPPTPETQPSLEGLGYLGQS